MWDSPATLASLVMTCVLSYFLFRGLVRNLPRTKWRKKSACELKAGLNPTQEWVFYPKYFNFPFPMTLTMIHMAFSGIVSFFLIRVFKVVAPVKMTFEIYATCVIPISAFFASSLWFGNTAYLHISVAFIQMLKFLMPVATFFMGVMCGTDKPKCDVFINMVMVNVGVVVSMSWWPYMLAVLSVFTVVTMWAVVVTEGCMKIKLQYYGFKLASAAR